MAEFWQAVVGNVYTDFQLIIKVTHVTFSPISQIEALFLIRQFSVIRSDLRNIELGVAGCFRVIWEIPWSDIYQVVGNSISEFQTQSVLILCNLIYGSFVMMIQL